MCERQRRLSQPYITRVQNQSALTRRQTIHVQKTLLVKQESKIHNSDILKRRNRRHSVANAITVAGVTEALLVGLLSRDRKGDSTTEDDLCSYISTATDMFTSLEITDSVTDLTSSDSVKTITDESKNSRILVKHPTDNDTDVTNNQNSSSSGTDDSNNSRKNKHSDVQKCNKQSYDSQWNILSARGLQDSVYNSRHDKIVTDV